jgi:AraC-like DNA-binding protein
MHVSIVMVRALVGALERAGVSRDRFFTEAGLDPLWIDDATRWLTLPEYMRAIEAGLTVSGDPALGLHLGEHVRPVMFDVVGPLAEHAATLRETFESIVQYARLITAGDQPELHEQGDLARMRFPSLRGNDVATRVTAELVMTALMPMLKMFLGATARPTRVAFAYEAPAYAAEYKRIFGGIERFDQPCTLLEFPRTWLDKAQPHRNPELFALLKSQADRTLGRLERDVPLSERIEQILARQEAQWLTMHEVARQLGMSARSLRRRMRTEGVSYSALIERHRMNAAKRMLEKPNVSIQETAYALGFESTAAFHRAFKRWTGMTPKQYRDSF